MTNSQKVGVGLVAASALNPATIGIAVVFLIGLPLILVWGLVSEIASPSRPPQPVPPRIVESVEQWAGDLDNYNATTLEKWFESRPAFAWSTAGMCARLPAHGIAWRRSREGKACTAATQANKGRPW